MRPRGWKRAGLLLCGGVGILFGETTAAAQNVDPFFFGDEAALASGAVVASGRDAGALWYNPAGFGGLKRGLVSASASTFGVRVRSIPKALRVVVGGQERAADLSSTDILSVPNAVVAATSLGDRYALAFGLLTTARDVRSALVISPDSPATSLDGQALTVGQRLDLQVDRAKYHVGGAFAVAVSPTVRLGAGVFLTYQKSTTNVQYALNAFAGPTPTGERAFVLQSARTTTSGVGVTGSLGAQWDVSPLVTLGATLRAPELAFSSSSEGGSVLGTASVGGTDPAAASLDAQAPQAPSATGRLLAPARLLGGVAVALGPPESFFEIGLDLAHGLPRTSALEARQPAVNARLGARYRIAPAWAVGGGLFTDRAVARSLSPSVGSDRVDYYGFTLGITKRTPLALLTNKNPEALVLATTFSLRSSVGFGEARGATIDLDTPNNLRDTRSDVTYLDLMPYLGSSVDF